MNETAKTRGPNFFEKFRKPSQPGLPKYGQLRETLVSAINAGHWKPGDKLPTEAELTRLTPFSLGTVQRALRALVDEGLVVRSQPSGTFVAEGRATLDAPLHLRFMRDEDATEILPIFQKVVSRERIALRGAWSRYLHQRDDNIIRIDRRLSIDGEFNVYSRFYINADRFGGIIDKPLSALDRINLKQLLSRELNLPLTQVAQRVLMQKFSGEICRAVGIKRGTPGLLLESVASAGRGNYIYYLESFIPPNNRKLVVSDA